MLGGVLACVCLSALLSVGPHRRTRVGWRRRSTSCQPLHTRATSAPCRLWRACCEALTTACMFVCECVCAREQPWAAAQRALSAQSCATLPTSVHPRVTCSARLSLPAWCVPSRAVLDAASSHSCTQVKRAVLDPRSMFDVEKDVTPADMQRLVQVRMRACVGGAQGEVLCTDMHSNAAQRDQRAPPHVQDAGLLRHESPQTRCLLCGCMACASERCAPQTRSRRARPPRLPACWIRSSMRSLSLAHEHVKIWKVLQLY